MKKKILNGLFENMRNRSELGRMYRKEGEKQIGLTYFQYALYGSRVL